MSSNRVNPNGAITENGIKISEEEKKRGVGKLSHSLKFLYVYALATGAILTFVAYWDGMFISYCGPATGIAFFLMMLLILPVGFVYSELASMFPRVGVELVYNTIGINKHAGFLGAWLILGAWLAVPTAGVMGMLEWLRFAFFPNLTYTQLVIIGIMLLTTYCIISLIKNVVAGGIQTFMLFGALGGVTITSIIFFATKWNIQNMQPYFHTSLNNGSGFGWIIGMALLITPFFGFEIVPQMVEEGTFPIKDQNKAIIGSVVTCGLLYTIAYTALAGVLPWEELTGNGTCAPFASLRAIINLYGWKNYAILYGIVGVLFTIGTCVLGFWVSGVRMLYAMGRQNYLPKAFAKTNRFGQPILPNIFILAVSIFFFIMMNQYTYLQDMFNLMSFSCASAYALTMYASILLVKNHPEWPRPYKLRGGMPIRWFAFLSMLVIAVFCLIGQNRTAWLGLFGYYGVGVLIWLWMNLVKWRKDKVWMQTPDGLKEY